MLCLAFRQLWQQRGVTVFKLILTLGNTKMVQAQMINTVFAVCPKPANVEWGFIHNYCVMETYQLVHSQHQCQYIAVHEMKTLKELLH